MKNFRYAFIPLFAGLVLSASSGCKSPGSLENENETTGSPPAGTESPVTDPPPGPNPSDNNPTDSLGVGADWHKKGVFMEIYVRAFKDSNGDGTGDFKGLTASLDYLRDLGI